MVVHRVGRPIFFVPVQEVLQRVDIPLRGTVQVLVHDFSERLGRDFAVVKVKAVEELAGADAVFGQPATQGGHVVGASGLSVRHAVRWPHGP